MQTMFTAKDAANLIGFVLVLILGLWLIGAIIAALPK